MTVIKFKCGRDSCIMNAWRSGRSTKERRGRQCQKLVAQQRGWDLTSCALDRKEAGVADDFRLGNPTTCLEPIQGQLIVVEATRRLRRANGGELQRRRCYLARDADLARGTRLPCLFSWYAMSVRVAGRDLPGNMSRRVHRSRKCL